MGWKGGKCCCTTPPPHLYVGTDSAWPNFDGELRIFKIDAESGVMNTTQFYFLVMGIKAGKISSISCDDSGNVYFGVTNTQNPDRNALRKLNSDGALQWEVLFGFGVNDTVDAVAVDNAGNLYAGVGVFLRKYDAATGTEDTSGSWPIEFSQKHTATSMCVDQLGNIYCCNYIPSGSESLHAFDSDGNLLWSVQPSDPGGSYGAGPGGCASVSVNAAGDQLVAAAYLAPMDVAKTTFLVDPVTGATDAVVGIIQASQLTPATAFDKDGNYFVGTTGYLQRNGSLIHTYSYPLVSMKHIGLVCDLTTGNVYSALNRSATSPNPLAGESIAAFSSTGTKLWDWDQAGVVMKAKSATCIELSLGRLGAFGV